MSSFFTILKELNTFHKYYIPTSKRKGTKFQLNHKDYNYLKNERQNKLIRLYEYVQNRNGSFFKFQKTELKILWSLYAFADPYHEKDEKSLKYLFGPYDKKESDEKTLPHFFLRAGIFNDKGAWIDEDEEFLRRLSLLSYSLRSKKSYLEVDFVKAINQIIGSGRIKHKERIAPNGFEDKFEVLYIPSGEIDFCILRWLFFLLKNEGTGIHINERFEIPFNSAYPNIIDRLADAEVPFPCQGERKTFEEWLQHWGITKENNEFTHRGRAMIDWLAHSPNHPFLPAKRKYKNIDAELLFEMLRKSPKINLDNCRFSVQIHFAHRFLHRPKGLAPSHCMGILGFPAFKHNEKFIGYSMSVIKDSDSRGVNYLFSDKKNEFVELITKVKTSLTLLGMAENREIYMQGIQSKHERELQKQSTKAAISQVMARNMSHNISSHVLSKYKSASDFDITVNSQFIPFADLDM